jgi:hypothetical protein
VLSGCAGDGARRLVRASLAAAALIDFMRAWLVNRKLLLMVNGLLLDN